MTEIEMKELSARVYRRLIRQAAPDATCTERVIFPVMVSWKFYNPLDYRSFCRLVRKGDPSLNEVELRWIFKEITK